jgi:hypothetical protein
LLFHPLHTLRWTPAQYADKDTTHKTADAAASFTHAPDLVHLCISTLLLLLLLLVVVVVVVVVPANTRHTCLT